METKLAEPTAGVPPFDVQQVRADFPILATQVGRYPLAYLDNAATSQKPQAVIDTLSTFYASENANIHRAVHRLSGIATEKYENARKRVASFLNAREEREIIFVRGATEAINLIASSWGAHNLREGDEVLITTMEHHANIVPWQLLGERQGVKLKVVPISDQGVLDMEAFERMLTGKVRLVSVVNISNALGTINPVEAIIKLAHAKGVPVLVDGSQSAAHKRIDVQALDCDFYVFSGHKVFGPTGIGVLYGRADILGEMPPYQGGGDMIEHVRFEGTSFRGIPERFEAGSPNIAGAIGLAAALDYYDSLDRAGAEAWEDELLEYTHQLLGAIEAVRIIGQAPRRAKSISFVVDGVHPHDLGTLLDAEGVAVRTGHHCCEPLMERFGLPGTTRASFAFYNTRQEVERLAEGIKRAHAMFSA